MTKTRKMTIKVFMDNIEIKSQDIYVSHHWFIQVRGMVYDQIKQMVKDFDVQSL